MNNDQEPVSNPQPSALSPSKPVDQANSHLTLDLGAGSSADIHLHLAPGSSARVTVQSLAADGSVRETRQEIYSNQAKIVPSEAPKRPFKINLPHLQLPRTRLPWPTLLILIAGAIYLTVRLIELDSFPIYFFTDEAVQTVLAQDMVRDQMSSYTGELLPTYLVNGSQYNLSTSVYIQILPYLIFGKSIWVTRGVAVLFTLLAAAALGLIFKNIFDTPYAFLGILVLSATPAWFLHSRTAFETALAVSFYAAFLYCYLMYRKGHLKYLWAGLVFGVLCFYSYSPAQMVMLVTGVGLFFSDLRYHWKKRRHVLVAILLGLLLAIPYFRFLYLHPDANLEHLRILNSYWIQDIPFTQKLAAYFAEYGKMINPVYWFTSNPSDLVRHVMKGYGHLLWWSFPLAAIGTVLTLLRARKPEYRLVLIALIAAPSGAALSGAGITRALFMVIPAALLTTLGLIQVLEWIGKLHISRGMLAGVMLVLWGALNGFMLRDALVNGPTWYDDYTLNGMQWGAKELFGEIKSRLQKDPTEKIMMSSSWANGTDVVARFFFNDPVPFELGSIDELLFQQKEINSNSLFILMADEYQKAKDSEKFKEVQVEKVMDYPDGTPGFYFVHLAYQDNIAEILENEKEQRKQLLVKEITNRDGEAFSIQYPQLDMGEIDSLFDGDENSVVRTLEANPMRMVITFEDPLELSEVTLRIGGTATTLTLTVEPEGDQSAIIKSQVIKESNNLRDITMELPSPVMVKRLIIEVKNTNDSEPAHVHLWEVSWQ